MKFKVIVQLLSIFGVILFFTACAQDEPKINLKEKPTKQIPLHIKKPTKHYKGTLYSQSGSSLFADKKDLQVGDILQVNISETLKNDTKNSRALSKKNSSSLGGGVFAPVKGVTNAAGTTARINKINNALGIGFNSTSTNTFNGSATTKVDEKFSTIISVVITQIFQNGNYFIEGTKELLINEQKQKIAISGIIRPYDISPDNTVLSSQIANLKILYKKDGEDKNSMKKPWGTKLLETIWPF